MFRRIYFGVLGPTRARGKSGGSLGRTTTGVSSGRTQPTHSSLPKVVRIVDSGRGPSEGSVQQTEPKPARPGGT